MKSLLLSDPEGRGNKEAMMSYILAWTLKRASSLYAKKILFYMDIVERFYLNY